MTTVATDGDAGGAPQAIGASDPELLARQDVGEYRVEACIGRGGFGTVYRALQPVIGKAVAIKVLARKYSADPEVVSRFVAEARAVNQIRHRNIIDIFSFGQLPDGRHYYVMELLEGETLAEALDRRGPLPLAEALPILRAIARAIDAAHGKGIAHRDLKPENIFLATDPDGSVFPKLLDFGIAKLLAPDDTATAVHHRTNTGVPIGTPYYMSPEQCRGKDVDARTDLYSFGVVAFRALTGSLPFEGDNYLDLMFKHVNDAAPRASTKRPGLPAAVDDAIAWMMAKAPADRPATLVAAVTALDPNASSGPPSLESARTAPRVAVPHDPLAATVAAGAPIELPAGGPKRRAWVVIVVVIVIVIVIAAAVVAIVLATRGGDRPAAIPPAPIADAAPPPVDAPVVDAPVVVDAPPPIDAAAVAPPPRHTAKHVAPPVGSGSGSATPPPPPPPGAHDIIDGNSIFKHK